MYMLPVSVPHLLHRTSGYSPKLPAGTSTRDSILLLLQGNWAPGCRDEKGRERGRRPRSQMSVVCLAMTKVL